MVTTVLQQSIGLVERVCSVFCFCGFFFVCFKRRQRTGERIVGCILRNVGCTCVTKIFWQCVRSECCFVVCVFSFFLLLLFIVFFKSISFGVACFSSLSVGKKPLTINHPPRPV